MYTHKTKAEIRAEFVYLLIIAVLTTFPYFLTRKTPPGYIIGGDTLVHAAIARGISLGRNPFIDQTYRVYPNWYPFLYHLLVATVSKGFHVSIETAMVALQAGFVVLMVITFFHVARTIWDDISGITAMALSLMLLTSHLYPNPKELAPIFGILFVLYFVKERWIVSGIVLGLGLWTHYASLFPLLATPIFIAVILRKKKALIPVAVSSIMFLPFFINVILHAQHIFPQVEDIYAFWRTDTITKEISSIIPPLYLAPFLLLSLLKWYRQRDFGATTLIVAIGTIWCLRVSPTALRLLGIQLWSARFVVILPYMYVLLGAYGLSGLKMDPSKTKALFVLTILLLIPLASSLHFWNSVESDRFVWISNYDLSYYFPQEHFVEVSEWIRTHASRDDVIATSEEAGMMLNALTGRPIVATLYGHGNTFLNNDARRRDLETLFTGSCNEKREVADRYNVRYIIIEQFVYEHWKLRDIKCIAHPVYKIGNVTIMEVRR